MAIPTEFRFIAYALGLYATFIYWGYLQEKLTSSEYAVRGEVQIGGQTSLRWNYPFVLNLSMSVTAALTAFIADYSQPKNVSPLLFWKASITAALASPIGYASLRYISYPMMILTKSSKPVPVMLVGILFYKRTYQWFKYISVLLLCCGIALFTVAKSWNKINNGGQTGSDAHTSMGSSSSMDDQPWFMQLLGVLMILVNLCLDGYTNNEQDHIYSAHAASPLQMMKYSNLWQALYLFAFLFVDALVKQGRSGLSSAATVVYRCPSIRWDILMFCMCASLGQVLICGLIKEFGSLAWITLSVTRQLFTVLLSVFIFRHTVNGAQWLGIALVFAGLVLEAVMVVRANNSVKDTSRPHQSPRDDPTAPPGDDRGRAESDDLERNKAGAAEWLVEQSVLGSANNSRRKKLE